MQTGFANIHSPLLEKAAAILDIPDSLHDDAVLKYEDVAAWLSDEESGLARYQPRVYPQGSFRLGTVVRPVNETDHYDIDLVCQLDIAKENTTQEALKTMVGNRLKERDDLKQMLEPSRRCWNLDYADNFHMDVLPCLDNPERKPLGIILTDTKLVHWQKSNPIAYADWFRERMRVAFENRRTILAKSLNADIESVPEWQVKTPLQRVVQLLKRHRDLYFATRPELHPISIIITTLAAKAYGNQMDVAESLSVVLKGMADHIEFYGDRYIVRNPVEPQENFADKWNEKPARREAFMGWLKQAQGDFSKALASRTSEEATRLLSPILGPNTIRIAASQLGIVAADGPVTALTRREPNVPALASTAHVEKPAWLEYLSGKVWVNGGVYFANKKGKKLWDVSTRPLPKGVALKFSATTNVREPYTIKWQVVNTGKEAREQGGLRGDFYDGNGSIRWETTQYAGTHWVEAFVIKDGLCVARSGRQLVPIRE